MLQVKMGDEMKTVQEWIRETDTDKLADAFFYEYPESNTKDILTLKKRFRR